MSDIHLPVFCLLGGGGGGGGAGGRILDRVCLCVRERESKSE